MRAAPLNCNNSIPGLSRTSGTRTSPNASLVVFLPEIGAKLVEGEGVGEIQRANLLVDLFAPRLDAGRQRHRACPKRKGLAVNTEAARGRVASFREAGRCRAHRLAPRRTARPRRRG